MKKLVKLLSIITMAAAGAFALVNVSNKSSENSKPQVVEASDITLNKDRTIIVAVWDNLDYTVWWSDTIALHYWGTGIDATVEVTKYGNNRLGYVTIPSGCSGCQVLRLSSSHQSFPISGYPSHSVDNKYDALNINDSNNVFTITGWNSDNRYWESSKVVLPAGMPVFVYSEIDWWFDSNAVTKLFWERNAWYGLNTTNGFVTMTRVNNSNLLYCVPSSTIIADNIQIERNVGGSDWVNGTTQITTANGYYNTCVVNIESGTNNGKQNWGPKGIAETVDVYGIYFNNTITCSGTGSITSAASKWTEAKNIYKGLSENVRGDIWKATASEADPSKHIQTAMYRYEYIVFYKQYSGYTDDFINRATSDGRVFKSPAVHNMLFATNDTTNSIAIIIVISLVSATAIGGFFFIKKRKETN